MSSIKQDLAYRGQLNHRLEAAKKPIEYGLLWSIREGQAREVADRVRLLSNYDRFKDFFRLELTEKDFETLYNLSGTDQRDRLLMGIVEYLLQDDVTTEDGLRLMPLLDLLQTQQFMFNHKREAILQGRLFFALKKVISTKEALQVFERFVEFDGKQYHCADYNSFFERAISLAYKGAMNRLDDLEAVANCRHMVFIRDENEVRRWITQLNSISLLMGEGAKEYEEILLHLGHTRAKHLSLWLEERSSVKAMQPFMKTKTIGSAKNASDAFSAYLSTLSAISLLHRLSPMKENPATALTKHALRLVAKHIEKVSSKQWALLNDCVNAGIDWKVLCSSLSEDLQKLLLEKLPSHKIIKYAKVQVRDRHFMGDLGL